ncbi:response regulator [Halomicroarcula limicola]|uniref:Response regulator n=1 Tax=Haloarcula limicola TaxID=1429915 RepID=A0A8J7Y7G5_9EURY|nr:response regulator [Halomicroarcula limicola]MBV0925462.1 response regulator [Halomicroarcula limicola]
MTATATDSRSPRVLLVEDNPADARLAKEAFSEIGARVSLTVVHNGSDALATLRGEGQRDDDVAPHLVLLDINLPGRNGGDILREIKSDDSLRRIPVVILTTSDESKDVERMYDNHANAYVTKPDSVSEYITVIDHLQSFWLSTATLPRERRVR